MLGIILIITYSLATKLVEYRLGYNFGQVFHDFSGNSRDGVNGDSSATTTYDTIPTDRGAYFDGSISQITLPPNDKVTTSISFPTTSTLAVWVLSDQKIAGRLFYASAANSDFFHLKLNNADSLLSGKIAIGSYLSPATQGTGSTTNSSNS